MSSDTLTSEEQAKLRKCEAVIRAARPFIQDGGFLVICVNQLGAAYHHPPDSKKISSRDARKFFAAVRWFMSEALMVLDSLHWPALLDLAFKRRAETGRGTFHLQGRSYLSAHHAVHHLANNCCYVWQLVFIRSSSWELKTVPLLTEVESEKLEVEVAFEVSHFEKIKRLGSKRRRARVRKPTPLTSKQTEAMQLIGEYKGNISAAAKAAGKSRTAMTKLYAKATKKLGRKAVKHFTKSLPTDRRGQVMVPSKTDE
jgi:hypothetical protein